MSWIVVFCFVTYVEVEDGNRLWTRRKSSKKKWRGILVFLLIHFPWRGPLLLQYSLHLWNSLAQRIPYSNSFTPVNINEGLMLAFYSIYLFLVLWQTSLALKLVCMSDEAELMIVLKLSEITFSNLVDFLDYPNDNKWSLNGSLCFKITIQAQYVQDSNQSSGFVIIDSPLLCECVQSPFKIIWWL